MKDDMFEEVLDEEDIQSAEQTGGRGRFSYPIVKMFIESGKYLVKLNTKRPEFMNADGTPRKRMSVYTSLSQFCKKNKKPVRVFQRGGDIYMKRIDIDKAGNPIEGWKKNLQVKPKRSSDITVDEDNVRDIDDATKDIGEEE